MINNARLCPVLNGVLFSGGERSPKQPLGYLLFIIYLFIYLFNVILFFYQLFWTQACPEGMCTNGTQVSCEVPSLPNPTTRKGWPHHRGLYDPYIFYSFQRVMWVLLRPTRTNQ